MMKGKVIFARIQRNLPKADYYLFAVYRDKGLKPDFPNFFHEPSLAPDADLWRTVQRMKAVGVWNAQAFQDVYVPRFKELMKQEPMRSSLDDLCGIIESGKTAVVMCWCSGDNCHRFLLYDELKERGYGDSIEIYD